MLQQLYKLQQPSKQLLKFASGTQWKSYTTIRKYKNTQCIVRYNTCSTQHNLSFNTSILSTQHRYQSTTTTPELTDEQKQLEQEKIKQFLKQINADEYADKFTTFDELLHYPSIYMKLRHNIPCQQRKAIRKHCHRYVHKMNVLHNKSYMDQWKQATEQEQALKNNIQLTPVG